MSSMTGLVDTWADLRLSRLVLVCERALGNLPKNEGEGFGDRVCLFFTPSSSRSWGGGICLRLKNLPPSHPSASLLAEVPARQVLIGSEQERRGRLEKKIHSGCGRSQTVPRGHRDAANPGPRIVLGGLAEGVPNPLPSPFLGILGDDPGARPGAGRLMLGGPSWGMLEPRALLWQREAGPGGGTGPGLGPGGPAVAVAGRWRSAARPSAASTTPRCCSTATVRPPPQR